LRFFPPGATRSTDKGIGPLLLKILLKFYQISECKRPIGAYPLRNFHEFCRVCTSFQDTLAVKIWMNVLKGLQSYEGFKLRGRVSHEFSASPPLAAKLCIGPQKFSRCKNVLEVLCHHAKFGGARFHPPPGWQKTLSFLYRWGLNLACKPPAADTKNTFR